MKDCLVFSFALLWCMFSWIGEAFSQPSLIKNSEATIPLLHLEEQNIALVSHGEAPIDVFSQYISLYSTYDLLAIDTSDFEAALALAENYTTLIITWTHPQKPNGAWQAFIELANRNAALIFCSFGEGPFEEVSADVWIHSNNQDSTTQAQLAQWIFTGPHTRFSSPIRLRYSPPEFVGWDSKALEKGIDSIVHFGLQEQAFPGCQVLVAKDMQVVFHKAYGFHSYDSARKVALDDLYDLASITKVSGPLAALMKLHGAGSFALDMPFHHYWKDFKNPSKKKITVREALAHQGGLQPYIVYWTKTLKKNKAFKARTFSRDSSELFPIRASSSYFLHHAYRKKIYKAIKKSRVNPEQGYVYSGLTFLLYPQIVKDLSGMAYNSYLRSQVYDRLGANRLRFNPYLHFPIDKIVPTEYDSLFRKELVQGYVHDEAAAMFGGISGNAGLFSNANDLAKLFQMYLNMGNYGGEQLIPQESLQEFTRYQFRDLGNRRGLGFDKPMLDKKEDGYVAPSASESSFGHSGFTGTFAWADPEHNLLLIFLSNRVHPTRENRKLYTLSIRPSLHELLYSFIEKTPRQAKEADN